MINEVSSAWIDNQKEYLTSSGYIEITCGINDPDAQNDASSVVVGATYFSDVDSVTDLESNSEEKIATLEWNFWVLDGSYSIPQTASYVSEGSGYIGTGNTITLEFSRVMENLVPGLIIKWGELYDEYPESFVVVIKNGAEIVGELRINDNSSAESVIEFPFSNYDKIEISVVSWKIPDRRTRVQKIELGFNVKFTKKDILSYSHNSSADPISGVLPKNVVNFSLDNIDNKWDISNPHGIGVYLTERQKISVRYGFDIDGSVEWIKGGEFYLYEWNASSNGMSVNFVARDALEFAIDRQYTTDGSEMTLYDHCVSALSQSEIPIRHIIDERLKAYKTSITDDYSIAEVLQFCANAVGDGIYQDRFGILRIEDVSMAGGSNYYVSKMMQYSHPEITLSKPLGSVEVTYFDDAVYTENTNDVGVKQTMRNEFISSEAQAQIVAQKSIEYLGNRELVSADFRADPRLDVFDTIEMEIKGETARVLVTEIDYSFAGAFKGIVKGRKSASNDLYLIESEDLYVADKNGNYITLTRGEEIG